MTSENKTTMTETLNDSSKPTRRPAVIVVRARRSMLGHLARIAESQFAGDR